ncbi:hypothetical protein GQ53DRAFT_718521 [Thozetella sp. PMI_491]|nr:hypothetical protein GQ53DRAFT_718521 [Thozetella sp. PMI_491]
MTRKRKPHTKSQTGCYTCKKRRIKCDETRPHCENCSRSRKECGGYPTIGRAAQPTTSWSELIGANSIIPGLRTGRTGREGRALEFFQYVVAPSFSLYPDHRFWAESVHVASLQDPAARHAVIAISSLVEQLRAESAGLGVPIIGRFALAHYNRALASLALRQADITSTLVLCLLFMCIESLIGNSAGVFEHCRHGVAIINSAQLTTWAQEHLIPLFVRQSTLPGLFGVESVPTVNVAPTIWTPTGTFDQLLLILDLLAARTCPLFRASTPYRIGDQYQEPFPEQLCLEQYHVSNSIHQWLLDFSDFQQDNPPTTREMRCAYICAHLKGLGAKTWLDNLLSKTEMEYDDDLPFFRRTVQLAEEMIYIIQPGTSLTPKFSFDLGHIFYLWVVVMKCRSLNVRRAALGAMDTLAIKSEGLWNYLIFRAIGKRCIELEHGIDLDAFDKGEVPSARANVPPTDSRIREVDFTKAKTRMVPDEEGNIIVQMRFDFICIKSSRPGVMREWIKVSVIDQLQRIVAT